MPRRSEEFDAVKSLLSLGLSDYEVSRRTGIPRGTVLNWRARSCPPTTRRRIPLVESPEDWRPSDAAAYCYLLGLYLGDGCIAIPPGGTSRLVLTLDSNYPGVIGEAATAMGIAVPEATVGLGKRPGCVTVAASHPIWPYAFPQHGPGRKHTRSIALVPWQQELTRQHPEALLRGLIHSDGSRVINRFKTRLPSGRVAEYAYVRYFFTNYSADIMRIFCDHCEMLGIRWTQSSFKNISVAHRDSVAILDSFIGPKR